MSQVIFNATQGDVPVEVIGGWDRPLRRFFLTVIFDDSGDDVSATDNEDTRSLRMELAALGITAPEGFWERVERMEGNVMHAWDQGAWVSN